MIDCHCHIQDVSEQCIRRAEESGVSKMIASGYDLTSSVQAKDLSERYDSVLFTAGFQPEELSKYRDGDLSRLKELGTHEKCVAIGEIGLDYHFDDNPEKSLQKQLFIRQLELANELKLPVVIHSRDACEDTLSLLKEHQRLLSFGGVMHCYSYSSELVEDFVKLGFYFSFGGTATFKNANKVKKSVEAVPTDRILTETDSPYLTPEPFRGTFPNEPKNIPYILEKIAEIKNVNKEELEKTVFENAKKLFFKLK